jgi:hypothetical protein
MKINSALLSLALLSLGVSCRPIVLSSSPQGVGSLYRATQSPDTSWYERDFNDASWERLTAQHLSKQEQGDTYLRLSFDVGIGAETATDIFLTFEQKPNFQQAYINGIALYPNPDIQGEGKALGFRLPKKKLHREDNILALSFAPNEMPQTPLIDPVIPAPNAQQITRGPYLLHPTSSGVTVAFETSEPCLATLRTGPFVTYESDPRASLTSLAPPSLKESTHHWVRVSSLTEATRYEYTIQCPTSTKTSGDILAKGTLSTAPRLEDNVSIVALTPGAELSPFANAATQAKGLSPDLAVLLGGALPSGIDAYGWNDLFRAGYGLFLHTAVIPALSVRLGALGSLRNTATLFALPNSSAGVGRAYSQNYGSVHIAVIDSDALFNPQAKKWLQHDAKEAKDKGLRVVVFLSRNALGGVVERVGRTFDRLLEDVPADLVVATGNKWFELGVSPRGLPYLLQDEPSTERQFSLIEVSTKGIWVRTYAEDGSITDDVKIKDSTPRTSTTADATAFTHSQ